jgi:pyruvate formate lyase activating enzyme
MQTPYIFNIQKFSTHDGPGIRTTFFFKGCPLQCMWCHNPESQKYEPEYMVAKDGKNELVGKQYSIKELVKKAQSDQIFFDRSGGGVTFSGGEVMTQEISYVEELAKQLKKIGISVLIDTCGIAPESNFKKLLPYVDGFLYDLKFLDSQQHCKFTGAQNQLALKNLQLISDSGGAIYLRLLLLKRINDDVPAMTNIISWLKDNHIKIKRVDLLPYHNFGRDKYTKLGRICTQNFEAPEKECLEDLKKLLEGAGYFVKIGG